MDERNNGSVKQWISERNNGEQRTNKNGSVNEGSVNETMGLTNE